MIEQSTLDKAIILATQAHSGQIDKAGKPYILHPLRVMLGVPEHLKVPAVLHDVIEDTDLTEIELAFVGARDLQIINLLTRNPETETFFQYIDRVATDPDAVIVKLKDLEDNMTPERMIGMHKPWSLFQRYAKAYYILSTL
jgi:(p)ppGpp synthase/HD superfamily hydrolase